MQHVTTLPSVRTIRKPKKSKTAIAPENGSDIGTQLKAHREKRKLSVEQVASRLKIRGHYIRALEEGSFSNIPGRIYVDGYLRSYADYLGLDTGLMMANYRGSGGRSSNDDNYMLPEVSHNEMKPGRRILWLALILLLLIYSLWFITDRHQEEVTQTTNAAANPTQNVAPQTAKALDARVVIVAKNDVDITIVGVDGAPLAQTLLHSGETYFVPTDGLLLKTSVPGNIQIFVDGENVAPTGKAIVTEAGIILNPEKLLENSGFNDTDDAVE